MKIPLQCEMFLRKWEILLFLYIWDKACEEVNSSQGKSNQVIIVIWYCSHIQAHKQ